jgi:hypothetical protein
MCNTFITLYSFWATLAFCLFYKLLIVNLFTVYIHTRSDLGKKRLGSGFTYAEDKKKRFRILRRIVSIRNTFSLFCLIQCCRSRTGSASVWLTWIRIRIQVSKEKKMDHNKQSNLISSLSRWLLYPVFALVWLPGSGSGSALKPVRIRNTGLFYYYCPTGAGRVALSRRQETWRQRIRPLPPLNRGRRPDSASSLRYPLTSGMNNYSFTVNETLY